MSTLETYLIQLAEITKADSEQGKYYRWVVENVHYWHACPNEAQEKEVEFINAQPKECYLNSLKLAIANPTSYAYYEGWAYPEGLIPIEHAWNLGKDKGARPVDWEIVDTTFKRLAMNDPGSYQDRLCSYAGIEVPWDFALQANNNSSRLSILFQWYQASAT